MDRLWGRRGGIVTDEATNTSKVRLVPFVRKRISVHRIVVRDVIVKLHELPLLICERENIK